MNRSSGDIRYQVTRVVGDWHELTLKYWVRREEDNHPFGSTTATEVRYELDDESVEYYLNDKRIELEQLERLVFIDNVDGLIEEMLKDTNTKEIA